MLRPLLQTLAPLAIPTAVAASGGGGITTIASDNFDSYPTGALNGNGSWSATNWTISTGAPNSGAHDIEMFTAGGWAYWQQNDGNSGNVQVSCEFNFWLNAASSFGNQQVVGVGARIQSPGASQNCYLAQAGNYDSGPSGLILYKQVAGTSTQLGSTVGSGSIIADGAKYNLLLYCHGTTISVQLKCLTGTNAGLYLNSGGAWQSAQAYAISVTDSSVTGQGYAGIYANDVYHNNTVSADDFLYQTS